MLDPTGIDLDDLATALADQTDGDHAWFFDPRTGQLQLWTSDFGLDGEVVDVDDLERTRLVEIEPVPSYVWYQHMVDFAEGVESPVARMALQIALQGKGAFRRFKDVLHQRFPELVADWRAHQQRSERQVALDWLADAGLVDPEAAEASTPSAGRALDGSGEPPRDVE